MKPEYRRALLVLFVALALVLVILDLIRPDSYLLSLFDHTEPPGRRIPGLLERLRHTRR